MASSPLPTPKQMFDSAVLGKLGFKRLQFVAKQIPAGIHDPMVGRIKLVFEFEVGWFKFKEWNFHEESKSKKWEIGNSKANRCSGTTQGLEEIVVVPVIIGLVI